MINIHLANEAPLSLRSDLAGEFPLYLYLADDKKVLLYSTNIAELLNDARVPKSLQVSPEGISFLLQSGVVPPPKTVYGNLFILGIGDTAQVQTVDRKIKLSFTHEFPFLNANRLPEAEMTPDEDLILQMLAEATINRLDTNRPSFLFHSAGKDSNSIALALAEAGWQDKVTLLTHKSKGALDESVISAKIAKQLGFKHQILHEVDQLGMPHKAAIEDYFSHAPFPCTDAVSLAYPLYALQLPAMKGANIIDGGGNDSYMMVPPSRRETRLLPIAKIISPFKFMRSLVNSESRLNSLFRTPPELFGMSGFSLKDAKGIYPETVAVGPHWKTERKKRSGWDIFDLKTDILTSIIASEVHIRKVRNFSDSINSIFVLPFANVSVASYFSTMPEAYLFDRNQLKNKLILRKILKERIGLDCDKIGKMGFSYDKASVIQQNWTWFSDQILNCSLWDCQEVQRIITRLKKIVKGKDRSAYVATVLLNHLILLSIWHNKNKYLMSSPAIMN